MSKTEKEFETELKDLGVALTGEETLTDLKALLKKAKVDAKGVKTTGEVAQTTSTVPVPEGKAKSSVHFVMKNGSRTFTKDEHGADFNDIADQFHETNSAAVIAREHDTK